MEIKVNILGHTLIKQGDKYNSYEMSYEKDGKDYKATFFGKDPLPTGEADVDIIKESDGFVKMKRVSKGGFNKTKWEPKTEEQLRIEERVKYPSFATSYAKDLVIAGKIDAKNLEMSAFEMFRIMTKLSSDKISSPASLKTTEQPTRPPEPEMATGNSVSASKDEDELPF